MRWVVEAAGRGLPRAAAILPRAAALVPPAGDGIRRAVLHVRRAVLSLPPSTRRRLAAALAAAAVLCLGYLFWFRDSALVRVDEVVVTGLTTKDDRRLREALTAAARDMTTLHLRIDQLERAAEGYPVVRSIQATADFPHRLRIHVIERKPTAVLVSGSGRRIAVAADGSLLSAFPTRARLPVVRINGRPSGDRLRGRVGLGLLAAINVAPAVIARRIRQVRRDPARGVVVQIRRGPRIVFGALSGLELKWAAAVRVLADPSTRGASYVDVRLPDRPAVGGLATATATSTATDALALQAPAVAPTLAGVGAPAAGEPAQPASRTRVDPASAEPAADANGAIADGAGSSAGGTRSP